MPEFSRPQTRLAYSGPLDPVVDALCQAYGLGQPGSFNVIALGYDDCNVQVETPQGRFVAKMFSKLRTPENRERYVTTMQKVIAAGVSHPALQTTRDGNLMLSAYGIDMVVMDYIDGQTFWGTNRVPSDTELDDILGQASIINSIPYQPAHWFDSWAVPNIRQLYDRAKEFVAPEDLRLAEMAIAQYEEIPVHELPQAFVHADLTKGNVITDASGRVYILDFSVSNWYPRIQELAVIAANLLHSDSSPASMTERCQKVAAGYQVFTRLTDVELCSLHAYSLAVVTSEFLGASLEIHLNGNTSTETESWLRLGRNNLRMEFGPQSRHRGLQS